MAGLEGVEVCPRLKSEAASHDVATPTSADRKRAIDWWRRLRAYVESSRRALVRVERQGVLRGILVAVLIGAGMLLHYGDDLPGFVDLGLVAPWLFLHTVHLPFVVLPIAYAAWVFGWRGGVSVLVATLALLAGHVVAETDADTRTLLGLHLISTTMSAALAVVAVSQWARERATRERNAGLLAASEKKYRALVEHNSQAIFLVDVGGNYLEVNPKACELTGYSRDEFLKMNVRQLLRPGQVPTGLAHALNNGYAHGESAFLKKGGVEFLGEIAITAFDLDGHRVALGILQDVTETCRLQEAVRAQTEALQEDYRQHIRSLGLALDARNPYTRGHAQRVREYAVAVARRLDLPGDRIRALSLAAELHDYGKIGIPDAILLKAGPLSPPEWAEIRRHPELTESLIEHISFLRDARPIIRAHHEKLDGSGYPDGLRGEAIPLEARIIGVVDAYDALTSDRPYRSALTHGEAAAILQQESGTKWDPVVVRAFLETLRDWTEQELVAIHGSRFTVYSSNREP
ncbi:MAG: PAS domain S-box protein [Chloroflexi bacterium]|nr:PAS domain S-box protein [Chloroflexota bacterium]